MPALCAVKVTVPAAWSFVTVVPVGASLTDPRRRGAEVGEESLASGEIVTCCPTTPLAWSACVAGTASAAGTTSTVSLPSAVVRPSETTSVTSRGPVPPVNSVTVSSPSGVVRASRPTPVAETRCRSSPSGSRQLDSMDIESVPPSPSLRV